MFLLKPTNFYLTIIKCCIKFCLVCGRNNISKYEIINKYLIEMKKCVYFKCFLLKFSSKEKKKDIVWSLKRNSANKPESRH